MNVIQQYANIVASYLPKKQQKDVADELFDTLSEQYQDLKSHTNLSEDEFIEQQGHPIKYAEKVGENDSMYLIGPRYYLTYVDALKTGAYIVVTIHLLLMMVSFISSHFSGDGLFGRTGNLLTSLLWVSVIITLVFVAFEKTGEKLSWLDNWSIAKLKGRLPDNKISRGEVLFETGVALIALLWIGKIIDFPAMVRHDGEWIDIWTVILPTWVWGTMAALLVVDVIRGFVLLLISHWDNTQRWIAIGSNALWIVLAMVVYNLDGVLLLNNLAEMEQLSQLTSTELQQMNALQPILDKSFHIGLVVLIAILAWDSVAKLIKNFK